MHVNILIQIKYTHTIDLCNGRKASFREGREPVRSVGSRAAPSRQIIPAGPDDPQALSFLKPDASARAQAIRLTMKAVPRMSASGGHVMARLESRPGSRLSATVGRMRRYRATVGARLDPPLSWNVINTKRSCDRLACSRGDAVTTMVIPCTSSRCCRVCLCGHQRNHRLPPQAAAVATTPMAIVYQVATNNGLSSGQVSA